MTKFRLLKSFGYAFAGIVYALKTEPNMVIHLFATIMVVMAGMYFSVSSVEWALLVLAIGLVLTAELLNTAIEATVDLGTKDIHPLAKIAKDTAAGGVLLAAICSLIIGLLVLGPHLILLLQ